ncbi:MAG: hypothetical protein RL757_2808 [Bacteroidota bacterium]|jgi:HSP20 family protein
MIAFKVNPFAPVFSNAAVRTFNTLADEFLNRPINEVLGNDQFVTTPAVNILEHADKFDIVLAAPGFQKIDFLVNIEKNKLTISSKKQESPTESEKTESKTHFTRREFNYAHFERVFNLPENISAEGISATYEQGILTVALPKVEPKKEVKNISVF